MDIAQFKKKYISEETELRDIFQVCLHQYFTLAKECDEIAEHVKNGEIIERKVAEETIESFVSAFKVCMEYKTKLGDRNPLLDVHGDYEISGLKIKKGSVIMESETLAIANKLYESSTKLAEVEIATYILNELMK